MQPAQPPLLEADPESGHRWNIWPWILAPLIVIAPFALDFGVTFAEYKGRENLIRQVIKPGMTEPEVIKALRPHRFVTGIGSDAYYVETKIRRPYTISAMIWIGQKLGKAPSPWRTLLPYEQCLVKMYSDGLVAKDFIERWTKLPY